MVGRGVQPSDDAALVAAAQEGDHASFAKLVERYQHDVYTVAMRIAQNPSAADDIAQETFVRAWRNIDGFRGEAAFSTWLHRIAVNTALTARTRRRRRATASIDDAPDIADTTIAADPQAMGDNAELGRRLQAALSRLAPEQRVVVVLKDVEGWSHQEIAEAVGTSVGATKVRLHRARARLRKILEAGG